METTKRESGSVTADLLLFAVFLGSAMAAAGGSGLLGGDIIAMAQASGPCALVTTDDVQSLAGNASVAAGVSTSFDALGFSSCRYTWGVGIGTHNFDVTLNDAPRMFSGMSPDQIKQGLQTSVTAGTADAVITEAGDAAVFKADSAVYVHATAYIKGRILQVHFDGLDARDKKDQLIALLKLAASRL